MENNFKTKARDLGLLMGLSLTLITVFIYAFNLSLFTSLWIMLLNFIIILGFGVFSAASAKKIIGEFPTFKEIFTSYTITITIGLLISTIIGIFIFNIIDPGAAETVKELSLEESEKLMRRFGAPESEIEKALIEAEKNEPFSLVSQIKNYFGFLAFMLVIGLLVSLIFRKKNPNAVNN